jgi:hypothetical protein
LKEGTSGAGTGRRKNRVRGALIVSQIAFSFISLIGAGLMLRSLQKLLTVDAGFSAQHVLAMGTTFSTEMNHLNAIATHAHRSDCATDWALRSGQRRHHFFGRN